MINVLADAAAERHNSKEVSTCRCKNLKTDDIVPGGVAKCWRCNVYVSPDVAADCRCGHFEPPIYAQDTGSDVKWVACDFCGLFSHQACYPATEARLAGASASANDVLFLCYNCDDKEGESDYRPHKKTRTIPVPAKLQTQDANEQLMDVYDCSLCHAKFTTAGSFKVHKRTKHHGLEPTTVKRQQPHISCDTCEFVTKSGRAYASHLAKMHGIMSGDSQAATGKRKADNFIHDGVATYEDSEDATEADNDNAQMPKKRSKQAPASQKAVQPDICTQKSWISSDGLRVTATDASSDLLVELGDKKLSVQPTEALALSFMLKRAARYVTRDQK
jgi:hypothetical protein